MQVRLPKTIETVCQVNANYPLSLLNDLTRLAQAIQRDEIIPMIASYPTPRLILRFGKPRSRCNTPQQGNQAPG
jgi:hypothetical protein